MNEKSRFVALRSAILAHRAALVFLFVGVLAPLLFFAKIADEVHEKEKFRFDAPILLGIHRHASPLFDRLMIAASAFGSPLLMTILCAALVAFFLWKKRRGDAAFFAFAVIGAGLLNFLAKAFFGRARPELWLSIAPRSDFSFPSGHAMGTMAVACAVVMLARTPRSRVLAIVLGIVFVGAVGFSRLYLGVHFPSDILGGWLASLAWVCGVAFLHAHRGLLGFRRTKEI